jgi:hypothetical protein
MTKQIINLGQTANDRTGDPLRTAFQKVNENFDELYSLAGADVQIPVQTGNSGKILTTNGTTLSWVPAPSTDLGDFDFATSTLQADNPIFKANDLTLTLSVNTYDWTFNNDGELVLPTTGAAALITSTSGAIQIQPKVSPSDGWDLLLYAGAVAETGDGGNDGGDVHILATAKRAPGTNGVVDITTAGGTWTFDGDGNLELPSGASTTSGAIQQRTTRTVTQGITTIEAGTTGLIYSGASWQTGFKLVIMVETRLDNNTDDVDHTQVCEATIASNYNSFSDPVMSVYGLTYTSPSPLATFEVHRTGSGFGGGFIQVYATNLQAQYNLQVSVHAIQFGSSFD